MLRKYRQSERVINQLADKQMNIQQEPKQIPGQYCKIDGECKHVEIGKKNLISSIEISNDNKLLLIVLIKNLFRVTILRLYKLQIDDKQKPLIQIQQPIREETCSFKNAAFLKDNEHFVIVWSRCIELYEVKNQQEWYLSNVLCDYEFDCNHLLLSLDDSRLYVFDNYEFSVWQNIGKYGEDSILEKRFTYRRELFANAVCLSQSEKHLVVKTQNERMLIFRQIKKDNWVVIYQLVLQVWNLWRFAYFDQDDKIFSNWSFFELNLRGKKLIRQVHIVKGKNYSGLNEKLKLGISFEPETFNILKPKKYSFEVQNIVKVGDLQKLKMSNDGSLIIVTDQNKPVIYRLIK